MASENAPAVRAVAAAPPTDPTRAAAPPISSRFLFVDVAAQRAKQLRRGALPRLNRDALHDVPHKLERLAMEEVRHGLVEYAVPKTHGISRAEER